MNKDTEILTLCRTALAEAERYVDAVRRAVSARLMPGGTLDVALVNTYQHEAHGYAWAATYVEALRALLHWADALEQTGDPAPLEMLFLRLGFAGYLAELGGGISMSQSEIVRPSDFGLEGSLLLAQPATAILVKQNGTELRGQIAALLRNGQFGATSHGDEVLDLMADQFRRFVGEHVTEAAHGWHRNNSYIPLEVIAAMAELGVFGLTIPEAFGGSGLGKLAMCIASEELSRGYIGVGSLGTRAEIAGELIQIAGTEAQKQRYLSRIASGAILPTAVFTEPNVGSDLASLRTRAELTLKPDGKRVWRVTGNKTWITHAARADLMTLLVRTDVNEPGHRGLSMLLAEKPRGDDANPFPGPGMNGGEIEVLGYRGMKEFEIRFDGFEVPEENLLGPVAGQGFKQLMETFESARIQTAARAVGVAQNALELGLRYALDRMQFGQAIFDFPRVHGKLAWMATETMIARQLCYQAARKKDEGKRCDIEAGMAKLLAARVAWANADSALQIHGGNGFALEYPISRVLCDARILNIFEGAAEIQAQVIARGLLGRGN
jgi:(2S)-methylsuccinyl-CoA dehydrogenase